MNSQAGGYLSDNAQLKPIVTHSALMRMLIEATIDGWCRLEHAPGFLEVTLRFTNGTVFSPMILDTYSTRVQLSRTYTAQAIQFVKRGELPMTIMKDGWSKGDDVGAGAVFALCGIIDLGMAQMLCSEINNDFGRGQKYAVLNMAAVTAITPEAKTFLQGFACGVEYHGRVVVMTAMQPSVEEELVLDSSNFGERIAIFANDEEAHKALKFAF